MELTNALLLLLTCNSVNSLLISLSFHSSKTIVRIQIRFVNCIIIISFVLMFHWFVLKISSYFVFEGLFFYVFLLFLNFFFLLIECHLFLQFFIILRFLEVFFPYLFGIIIFFKKITSKMIFRVAPILLTLLLQVFEIFFCIFFRHLLYFQNVTGITPYWSSFQFAWSLKKTRIIYLMHS